MVNNMLMHFTEQNSMVFHISAIMLSDFILKIDFVNPTSVFMRLQGK